MVIIDICEYPCATPDCPNEAHFGPLCPACGGNGNILVTAPTLAPNDPVT